MIQLINIVKKGVFPENWKKDNFGLFFSFSSIQGKKQRALISHLV